MAERPVVRARLSGLYPSNHGFKADRAPLPQWGTCVDSSRPFQRHYFSATTANMDPLLEIRVEIALCAGDPGKPLARSA